MGWIKVGAGATMLHGSRWAAVGATLRLTVSSQGSNNVHHYKLPLMRNLVVVTWSLGSVKRKGKCVVKAGVWSSRVLLVGNLGTTSPSRVGC